MGIVAFLIDYRLLIIGERISNFSLHILDSPFRKMLLTVFNP